HERVRQLRRAVEGRKRALEPPLPAVRVRERARRLLVRGGERGKPSQPFAIGRRLLDGPRQRRKRSTGRRAPYLVALVEAAHLVPERARLARRALVARGLAHEVEAACRSSAGGVEEITVALDRVGFRQPSVTEASVEL